MPFLPKLDFGMQNDVAVLDPKMGFDLFYKLLSALLKTDDKEWCLFLLLLMGRFLKDLFIFISSYYNFQFISIDLIMQNRFKKVNLMYTVITVKENENRKFYNLQLRNTFLS